MDDCYICRKQSGMGTLTCTFKEIRNIYADMVRYYAFDYSYIEQELSGQLSPDEYFKYVPEHETAQIADGRELLFGIDNGQEILSLLDKYPFVNEHLRDLLTFAAIVIPRMQDASLNFDLLGISDVELCIIPEQKRILDFLTENESLAGESMTIRLGRQSIEIDNHDRWLYHALRSYLHKVVTFDGKVEYHGHPVQEKKPSRAPSFSNFIAYNTYLLLKDRAGSERKFPAEFLKFIIEFCSVCHVALLERQRDAVGMKEFLSSALRQYRGIPMSLSVVR